MLCTKSHSAAEVMGRSIDPLTEAPRFLKDWLIPQLGYPRYTELYSFPTNRKFFTKSTDKSVI